MKRFFHRHQPPVSGRAVIKSGIAGFVAIALLAALAEYSGVPLLIAPFGASCVLLFAAPSAPLSQPANLVGGHLASTTVGLMAASWMPTEWWAIAFAVGISIALMHALRITHPPAGADPIVVFLAHPGWGFLLFPILAGSVALVLCALILRAIPPKTAWPLPIPD